MQLLQGALGASLTLLGLALGGVSIARAPEAGASADAPDAAIWVYGAHRWGPDERDDHLARLGAIARRLYLSVEDGPRLVVDDPDDARRLGELLDRAAGRFGLAVEAMLLQDPSWVSDPTGAVERVARVVAFHAARRASGRPGFAGLHFDLEPHTTETWECAVVGERAAIVRGLQDIFRRARAAARAGAPAPSPTMSAALPWWLGPLSAEVPNTTPAKWLVELDEVVLMVYGEPGGPLVGESGPAVLRRVDDTRLWQSLPPGRGLRIGLATFEHRDPAALRATIDEVTARIGVRRGFRGVAIFAHEQPYDAPLLALVEGRLLDASGRPVTGARIRGAGHETETNRCGVFRLKGLPTDGVRLEVAAPGYVPARVGVGQLVPGRLRDLPPVRLERSP